MQVKEPIIIVGTGRSGSTLFYEMMSGHPNAAWMSTCCKYFPAKPAVNRHFMQLIDWPLVGSVLKRYVHPREYYEFWDYWFKGFSVTCRDLVAEDVTQSACALNTVFGRMLTPRRNRLILKITGWPRIGFLREIFPDAKFIHIMRDGRSVSSSMLQQSWWWGWRGPENWRWGQLTPQQRQLWEKYDKSFVVLAAIEWMILMESFDKAAARLTPDKYKIIKYEDLCESPGEMIKDVLQFCGLQQTDAFSASIARYPVKSAGQKWKTELNNKQRHDLQEVLAELLRKHGYEHRTGDFG